MNARILGLVAAGMAGLLGACEGRRPPEAGAGAAPDASPANKPAARPAEVTQARALPDSTDLTRPLLRRPGPADSLIQIGAQHFRLSVRVETDSTQPIDFAPAVSVGPGFAAPSDTAWVAQRVRGYAETYTFTLRDSVGKKVLFRRRLSKPDFYGVAPRDIAVVTSMPPPTYLGYSAGLDALVFVCYLGIPFSDVGHQATLLLDRQGRVRRLSPGGPAYSDAPDCDPRISPSGRAVLTCTELLRAGRPPLPLTRPHAVLRTARFLTDTTLLVLYEHGDYVAVKAPEPSTEVDRTETAPMTSYEWRSTPAQRRLPTAHIISTSGRILRKFDLTAGYALYSELPRVWVRPARTYLMLEEDSKLVLIPKARPDSLTELPLKMLPRYQPPRRPHEKRFELRTEVSRVLLYVDTLQPRQVRYQKLALPAGG